jgi:threonyl-tRNA synthetase
LPIAAPHVEYAQKVKAQLEAVGIRVELDDRNEKIGYKIREAQLEKIPYMFVIGDQEAASDSLAVRKRGAGDIGVKPVTELLAQLAEEVRTKAI